MLYFYVDNISNHFTTWNNSSYNKIVVRKKENSLFYYNILFILL